MKLNGDKMKKTRIFFIILVPIILLFIAILSIPIGKIDNEYPVYIITNIYNFENNKISLRKANELYNPKDYRILEYGTIAYITRKYYLIKKDEIENYKQITEEYYYMNIDREYRLPDVITIYGKEYKETDFKNKIIVIDFWFTTCKPCCNEIPKLNNLVDYYKDDSNIILLAITFEKPETINKFIRNTEIKYEIIPDRKDILDELYVGFFPCQMIIDDGKIVYIKSEYSENIDEIIINEIEKILKYN